MSKRVTLWVVVLAVLGSGVVGGTHAGSVGAATVQQTCDFQSLYGETVDSVVKLQVLTDQGPGQGSGFVFDLEGNIVTNQHVVANASTVDVQFNRGEWRTAEVIGTDVFSDLAVLSVNDTPDYVTPLAVNAVEPEAGQPVAAFGSPLGLGATITDGIVSGTNRSMPAAGAQGQGPRVPIPNTVQTTAAINPGNSGGPLVNCEGEVIGVSTATLTQTENTGFAVPASRVEQVVPSLIATGGYANPFLGVQTIEVSPTIADANGIDEARGVLVVQTEAGSPAASALQRTADIARINGVPVPTDGDVILAIDGEPVNSPEELQSRLTVKRPGNEVTLTILRDGEETEVQVTLGERPVPDGS